MSKLCVYDPIYGAFFKKTAEYDSIRAGVRSAIGEETFKRGYSDLDPSGATKALGDAFFKANIKPVTPTGIISSVGYTETDDGAGNQYKKVRISLAGEEELLLSIDIGTDVAKRLIAKLINYQPNEPVKISAWAILESKNGRTFINHSVSVKTLSGVEVPAKQGLFAIAKTNAEDIINAASITDKKVIDSLKKSEQNKLFLQELLATRDRLSLKGAAA